MDEEGLVSLSFAKGPLGFTLSKSDGRTITSIQPPGHSLNANAAATEKLEVGWVLERVGGKRVVRDKALIAAQIKSAQRPVLLTWRVVRGDSPRSGGSAAASAAPRAEQQSDTEDSDEDELWGTKTAPPLDSPHKVAEEGVPPRPEGHELDTLSPSSPHEKLASGTLPSSRVPMMSAGRARLASPGVDRRRRA